MAACYAALLRQSISVVACNKIACSSPYRNYRHLKDLAREYNARFLFETNVGAGLPVIGTLNDLLRSGDTIRRIEAVLSGTLNFVFNHYNGDRPFADVVRQAQDEGYTEPDPRLDLSGTDVMRKIMILAREAGEQIEMDDIANHSFLPASCMQGTVEDFYAEMAKEEDHFRQLYEAAAAKGKKLKFVAQYDNGKVPASASGTSGPNKTSITSTEKIMLSCSIPTATANNPWSSKGRGPELKSPPPAFSQIYYESSIPNQ